MQFAILFVHNMSAYPFKNTFIYLLYNVVIYPCEHFWDEKYTIYIIYLRSAQNSRHKKNILFCFSFNIYFFFNPLLPSVPLNNLLSLSFHRKTCHSEHLTKFILFQCCFVVFFFYSASCNADSSVFHFYIYI